MTGYEARSSHLVEAERNCADHDSEYKYLVLCTPCTNISYDDGGRNCG